MREALGWAPTYSNDEMFAASYDWFLTNRDDADDAVGSHHRRTARSGALAVLERATRLLP